MEGICSSGRACPSISLATTWDEGTEGDPESKTYVQYNDKKEIHISNIMELEPDIFGDEGDRSIFGRADLISRIVVIGDALFIAFRLRHGDVEVDATVDTRTLALGLPSRTTGLGFFILVVMPLVQAIHDGDPFPHAPGAVGACGGPS